MAIEKVRKLRENIPITNSDPLAKMRESMQNRTCTFNFQPVTETQVTNIISGLRGSKATGMDFIDIKSLKLVSREISPCLAHIIKLRSLTMN